MLKCINILDKLNEEQFVWTFCCVSVQQQHSISSSISICAQLRNSPACRDLYPPASALKPDHQSLSSASTVLQPNLTPGTSQVRRSQNENTGRNPLRWTR